MTTIVVDHSYKSFTFVNYNSLVILAIILCRRELTTVSDQRVNCTILKTT